MTEVAEFAAVVLAHADPAHLRTLLHGLDGVPVFLHVDRKTPDAQFREMVEDLPARVTVLDRVSTRLASWSLVEAELLGLRRAIGETSAEHIAVLSGADYPLLSMPALLEELSAWSGHSYLWNVPLPFARWDTPRHPTGGLWRLDRRFLVWREQVIYVRSIPLRVPRRRALPASVEIRASSQWKVYARRHVERLLDVVGTRPDLVRFWRSTLVPEETFAASVLASPALVGDDAISPCTAHAWYIRWPPGLSDHPYWLADADFPDLAAARYAPPVGPAEAQLPWEGEPRPGRKLFARKFSSSRSGDVVERIEKELRGCG